MQSIILGVDTVLAVIAPLFKKKLRDIIMIATQVMQIVALIMSFGCEKSMLLYGYVLWAFVVQLIAIISIPLSFNRNLKKSSSISEFTENIRTMYYVSLLIDIVFISLTFEMLMMQRNIVTWIISVCIYIWSIMLIIRDCMTIKDIKKMRERNFASTKKVITFKSKSRTMLNKKYSTWFIEDENERNLVLEKGKKYTIKYMDYTTGEYYISIKEFKK